MQELSIHQSLQARLKPTGTNGQCPAPSPDPGPKLDKTPNPLCIMDYRLPPFKSSPFPPLAMRLALPGPRLQLPCAPPQVLTFATSIVSLMAVVILAVLLPRQKPTTAARSEYNAAGLRRLFDERLRGIRFASRRPVSGYGSCKCHASTKLGEFAETPAHR